ncbi:radical SAM superfamily protein [Variibacter gotjawalensis]|uniref:Radical SAM superfamily protein n=1 Tax=Variibacter gotjawalensis TaxID=1333996 RepID=A0A0S3PS10_9BRAD|nr:PA0069 family radical SAM protein [Variibacter gotjawalensis]NIK49048.1 DNA repair photolyase [Variibacter gotjawalensis]RZS50904.1 DNA repair photolyase [Variibacter gotjawalensis]BAT58738.1 radical SAM superfamily protein [Variibacter gotjawalensis]
MARSNKPFPKKPVFANPVKDSPYAFTFDETEIKPQAQKGRGAVSNQASTRFERYTSVRVDDGWQHAGSETEEEPRPETQLFLDTSRSIVMRNDSPDIGFSASLNPYRGCEHGCVYCFARPSHAYLGMSPGLDFETKIFHKPNAAELLRAEFARRTYRPESILIGINTDCYQPLERKLEITRSILKVMDEHRHPCSIITKSALILRDLDILAPMAARRLVRVAVTLGTLSADIHRKLEPRAPAPQKRVATMRALSAAGIPVTIMVAPMIPAINDHEVEGLLEAAHDAGVRHAGYTVLRLPWELKQIFEEWLTAHFPDRASHVLSLLRQIYGGKLYDSAWGVRGRGTGPYAQLIGQRFRVACEKLGLNRDDKTLDHSQFRKPSKNPGQMEMFGD